MGAIRLGIITWNLGNSVPIVQNASRPIYFKSAPTMKRELTSRDSENAQLRNLTIRNDIQKLAHGAKAGQPSFSGVRFRNRSLAEDIGYVKYISKQYSKKGTAELNKWSSLTSYRTYATEMLCVLDKGSVASMVVATDSIAIISTLQKLVGADRLFYVKLLGADSTVSLREVRSAYDTLKSVQLDLKESNTYYFTKLGRILHCIFRAPPRHFTRKHMPQSHICQSSRDGQNEYAGSTG
eukprot:IDg12337t1